MKEVMSEESSPNVAAEDDMDRMQRTRTVMVLGSLSSDGRKRDLIRAMHL